MLGQLKFSLIAKTCEIYRVSSLLLRISNLEVRTVNFQSLGQRFSD